MWAVRILFVLTFFSIPLLPLKLGFLWPFLAMVPGALVMLLLWPSVLGNKEMSPRAIRTTRTLSVALLCFAVVACALLNVYA